MPLFRCDECGCVDNTALAPNYWREKTGGRRLLCTECTTGEWHGEFEKRPARGMYIDSIGHLWSQDIVDKGLPDGCVIVGRVE